MPNLTVFIQVHGRLGILEAELPESATFSELNKLIDTLGVERDANTVIFVDESGHHLQGDEHARIGHIRHGSRVHVCRCRRVKVKVHFTDRTAEHEFAPGARVRAVKEFAVHKFGLNPKDAAEHVLQLCGSTKRPATDTPLNELLAKHECALRFDLVPEKRVEGAHE
jgi:hypothetical protein